MRLATQYDRIHAAGAETIAVSVDSDERQAGMARRWGLPSTRFVADPGGERFLQALDLYDPEERNGIALPALLVIGSDGSEPFRSLSRDFADRTHDDDVLEALEDLDLPPIEAPHWTDDVVIPDDLRGYFRTDEFEPYFKGNFFGALAIGWRIDDQQSRGIAREHRTMSRSMLDAMEAWADHIG